MAQKRSDVVLVTGGSGFLAQHLLRELCSPDHRDFIREIRVADKRIFKNFLNFDAGQIPIKEFVVDCSIEAELESAVKGCTVVYNLCGRKFPMEIYQDKALLERDNVDTVKCLVALMQRHNVKDLIHVSDAFVAAGSHDCQAPTEISTLTPPEGDFLIGAYGRSKFDGEQIARRANGLSLSNGETLRTVILRPCCVYGEGESLLIPHAIGICRQYGCLQRLGAPTSRLQTVYAGNVAAQMCLALTRLRQEPEVFGGEVFFATEGTHLQNYYDYVEPYVKSAGFSLSRWSIPVWIARLLILMSQLFFLLCYNLVGLKLPHNLPSYAMLRIAGMNYYHFSGAKSHLLMKFQPKYDRDKAMQTTADWWANNWRNYV